MTELILGLPTKNGIENFCAYSEISFDLPSVKIKTISCSSLTFFVAYYSFTWYSVSCYISS